MHVKINPRVSYFYDLNDNPYTQAQVANAIDHSVSMDGKPYYVTELGPVVMESARLTEIQAGLVYYLIQGTDPWPNVISHETPLLAAASGDGNDVIDVAYVEKDTATGLLVNKMARLRAEVLRPADSVFLYRHQDHNAELQRVTEAADERMAEYKRRIGEVAKEYAVRNDWCGEVKRAVAELEVEWPKPPRYSFEMALTVRVTATLDAEDLPRDMEEFIRNSIRESEVMNAIGSIDLLDSDWSDESVDVSGFMISDVDEVKS